MSVDLRGLIPANLYADLSPRVRGGVCLPRSRNCASRGIAAFAGKSVTESRTLSPRKRDRRSCGVDAMWESARSLGGKVPWVRGKSTCFAR